MKTKFWTVFISMVVPALLAVVAANNRSCAMDNFPIMMDFDEAKFAGLWYQIKFLNQTFPAEFARSDYSHEYSVSVGQNMTIYHYGRRGQQKCTREPFLWVKTDKPSIYTQITSTNRRIPCRILKTDYTVYGIEYCCWKLGANGTCAKPEVVLMGRTTSFNPDNNAALQDSIRTACVSPSDGWKYYTTKHTINCKEQWEQAQSCGNTRLPSGLLSAVVVFIILSLLLKAV